MKKLMISGMVTLLVVFSACAQKEMVKDPMPPAEKGTEVVLSSPEIVIDGLNGFAFDIYRKLNGTSENNEFISPLSISSALAMTYAGAEGKTAKQMQEAMHFGPQQKSFHHDYGIMLDSLSKGSKDFEVRIANAVWVQNDFPLLDNYLSIVRDDYFSESRELDFVKKPEASRKTINDWVEDKTNDRIKDLIPNGVIDADTRMILTNAVYFNAEWAEQFNKEMTRKDAFLLFNEGQVNCDMMYMREDLAYSSTDDLQIVEIPYKGYQYSMMILLPYQRNGLKGLLQTLDADLLEKHKMHRKWEDILLYLPKYKLEADYELVPALAKLGMEEPFSDLADFSGMTGNKDLKISSVIHKTFIDVDEFKTEAAAATAVVMKMTAMPPAPRAPIEFRVDHPFLFLIRHNESGAILFMGQVTNPEAK